MDSQIIQFYVQRVNKELGYLDLSNFVRQLLNLEDSVLNTLTPKNVLAVLVKNKAKFENNNGDYKFCMSQIHKRKKLFELLLHCFYFISQLYIWDSIITEDEIRALSRKRIKLEIVVIVGCQIKNSLYRQLFQQFDRDLQYLHLDQLTLDNRVMKQLTKIDFPQLKKLSIGNAFLTGDCSKMISKRSNHKLQNVSVNFLPFNHEHLFLKDQTQCLNLRSRETLLGFMKKSSLPAFLFLNHLSKIERTCDSPILRIHCTKDESIFEDYYQSMCLIPSSTRRNIEQVISIL